jgi:tRNA threonylcarbamoyladenosine biosynthesis protein TsaE
MGAQGSPLMRYTAAMNHEPGTYGIRLLSMNAEETERFGETLASTIGGLGVVTLEGDLGAGKTQFVRGMSRSLALDCDEISSPTFVICMRHDSPQGTLAHMDAYRLAGDDELESVGFDEMVAEDGMLLAIEWASRIESSLPAERIDVHISHRGQSIRGVEIVDHRTHDAERMRLREAFEMLFDTCEISPRNTHDVCPSCGAQRDDSGMNLPFCSLRCRMADLNSWFSGRYMVSRPVEADEELDD